MVCARPSGYLKPYIPCLVLSPIVDPAGGDLGSNLDYSMFFGGRDLERFVHPDWCRLGVFEA
jgi:hypothetical protein